MPGLPQHKIATITGVFIIALVSVFIASFLAVEVDKTAQDAESAQVFENLKALKEAESAQGSH